MGDAAAVRAVGLMKTYGVAETRVVPLNDVSMELGAGQVAALLGPSGAGKSTLLKALGLIGLPDSGTIWLDGVKVFEQGRTLVDVAALWRDRLGFVFQKANLISFLTARENIEVSCEIGGMGPKERRARAAELLRYLDIESRADAYPDELSGGQQQRVAIARALANSPSLLLADEPTAALDSARGRAVMELFRKVAHDQGAAVLVVTHDHRSLDVFDITWEMEDGVLRDAASRQGVSGSETGR
jgi:putative ABC transport system ATP-binding protein